MFISEGVEVTTISIRGEVGVTKMFISGWVDRSGNNNLYQGRGGGKHFCSVHRVESREIFYHVS